jgi:precorrin-6Y C5,15-methyltransferase (decarboxylating)
LYRVLRGVALHPLVAVFTSPANGPDRIARALLTVGYGAEVRLSVAARLACPDEAVFPRLHLEEVADKEFLVPNVVILERATDAETELETGAVTDAFRRETDGSGLSGGGVAARRCSYRHGPVFGLADDGFARQGVGDGTGLITKLEVRVVSLAKLGLRPDSLVWDIGAGSGAVGLEASRAAYLGHCWAIEKEPAQAADARTNARRLRASNYSLYEGRAPDGLADWPDPDAVFIGGSGGALDALIELIAVRLRPGGRLVMNLIALENLVSAIAALDRAGLTWDLIQLGVARSQPILGLHRFAALNPVWMLSARKESCP